MTDTQGLSWGFSQIWNDSLEQREEKPLSPRNRIWASEIGSAYVDRYLKMRAEPYSNPPDKRAFRKFEAGNLFEWVVGMVLKRTGLEVKKQGWIEYKQPGLLEVGGYLDYQVGGIPDIERANANLEMMRKIELPATFLTLAEKVAKYFSDQYSQGAKTIVLEIKSTGSYLFDAYERTGTTDEKHKLQAFHYLLGQGKDEGHVVYISKDDLRLLEIGIWNPSPLKDLYMEDVKQMTYYHEHNEMPPLEPHIVWFPDTLRFAPNWKVQYSNYLTRLYGFTHAEQFKNTYQKTTASWNRVFGRCVRGDNMTKLNLEVIGEIRKSFPAFDDYVERGRKKLKDNPDIDLNGEESGEA